MPTGFQAGSAYTLYSLDLTQFDRDLARIKREMDALQKNAVVPVSVVSSAPRITSDAQAANAALRLAQARANLARAEGDEARALTILNTALAQNSAATETVSLRVQTAAARLQSGKTFASEFGESIKSGLLGIVGPAALASAAIGGIIAVAQSFKNAINFKANLDASTASIKSQLDGFRDANATYAEALAFGRQYAITQQQTNEILSSSTDILRTSTASVSQLESALIRLQSRDVSKPISEASRALRELQSGDTTSIKELFNIPAKDALRMRNEIAAGGDAVKVLTSYLDSAKIGMTALEQRTKGMAGALNEAAQAQEAVTIAQGKLATSNAVVAGTKMYAQELQILAGFLDNGIEGAKQAAKELAALQAQQQAYANALAAGKTEVDAAAAGQQAYALVMNDGAVAADNAAAATEGARIAQRQLTDETNGAANAIVGNSQALADQTEKTLASQLQTQQLAQFQQDLAHLGNAVAGGLMTAGAAALQLAQQYGIASSEAVKLIGLQAELARRANAKIALADQRAGERAPGSSGVAEAAATEEARLQALYRKLQDPPKTSTIGRAGGAKLSDQQKLNATLASDQLKADQQAENAARDHGKRLLAIERQYQEKSLAQQRQNEISKRESELSFLEKLTGSSLNKGDAQSKAALQQINQDYYAAYAKAQEIAQAGNAQLSEAYLKLKQEQYEAELQYQEQLQQAREAGDAGEVARLQALEAKRQAIYAEREKQLLANGDANANARDQAIADENQRYTEAQDKNATAADQAANRKIAAAERSGKAIDAETAAVERQAAQYARMGRAAPDTTTAPTPATSTTNSTTPNAAQNASLLAVADAAVLGAIQAQTAMQSGKFDALIGRMGDVERAVRMLSGAFAR